MICLLAREDATRLVFLSERKMVRSDMTALRQRKATMPTCGWRVAAPEGEVVPWSTGDHVAS